MVFIGSGLKIPKLDKRLLFTDDVSRIYQDALTKIDHAAKTSGEAKSISLRMPQELIAAILQEDQPGDIKGSAALERNKIQPYYELARVTFYLEMEGRK